MSPEIVHRVLQTDFSSALLGVGLICARLGPAVWIAPFLGGRMVPSTVKTGLMLVLSLAFYPSLLSTVAKVSEGPPLFWVALVLKEVAIGTTLGFVVGLIFQAAEAAGRLIDTVRGASFSEVMVPQTGVQSSPLGSLYLLLTLALFFSFGGHRLFLGAIGASYGILPLASFPRIGGLQGFSWLCLRLTGDVLYLALALSAPMVAAIFLAEVSLGLIGRSLPHLHTYFLAMPIKALLGIALLVLSLGLLAGLLPGLIGAAMQQALRAVEFLGK
jgi:type III secretion protein SpaR/YscT/HrcT